MNQWILLWVGIAFSWASLAVTHGAESDAARVRWERLKPLLGVMRQSINQPGPVGDAVRETLKDRSRVLFNQDVATPESVRKARLVVATLYKDRNTRDLLVSLANSQLRDLSNDTKEMLAARRPGNPFAVDELVVGAGPHGTAYVQQKTTADPNAVVMIIDQAKRPGGTFADVGSAFALNSTNRRNTGARAVPGLGDLNYVHDIVGLPDFRATRWVEAGSMGDISSVGVYLSSALPVLEADLVGFTRTADGAGYVVQLQDKRTGRMLEVFTKNLTFASGLGIPTAPFTSGATLELIDLETRSAARARTIPRIEYFPDFINRVGNPENRNPIRDMIGKDVVVVGAGDSGKVVNELLTGLGPEEAYRADVAQLGQVKRIYWFLNYDGIRTCREYIAKSRARYSRLAQALNSGLLVPVVGRVDGIREEAGRFKFELSINNAAPGEPPRTLIYGNDIRYIAPADPRRGTAETVVQEAFAADKVILATGFKSRLPELIAGVTRLSFKQAWQPVERVVPAFGERPVVIANELRDAPGVRLVGPANEELGGLPRREELRGVNENTVSLFANVERTKATATVAASERPQTDFRPAQAADIARATASIAPIGGTIAEGAVDRLSVKVDPAGLENVRRVPMIDLALRIALDRSLSGFRPGPGATEALSFELKRVPGESSYSVELKRGVSPESAEALGRAFGSNALLGNLLLRDVEAVDVVVPVTRAGRLDLRRIGVTARRR